MKKKTWLTSAARFRYVAMHTIATGAMRHSLAANNGVVSLLSNSFTLVLFTGTDAWVLKRLTLDNRADTGMQTKSKYNFRWISCYVTLALCLLPFNRNEMRNHAFTFSSALGTKHHWERHFNSISFKSLICSQIESQQMKSFRSQFRLFSIILLLNVISGHAKRQLDRIQNVDRFARTKAICSKSLT